MAYSGHKLDLGGTNVMEVLDMTTTKTNGTVILDSMVQLKGNKVKCVSTDGSGIGKPTLYNETELGEE